MSVCYTPFSSITIQSKTFPSGACAFATAMPAAAHGMKKLRLVLVFYGYRNLSGAVIAAMFPCLCPKQTVRGIKPC